MDVMQKVRENNARYAAETARQRAERGIMEKLWDGSKGFIYLAAYLGFCYVVGIAQLIPLWLGVALFALPTIVFVITAFVALFDPYWFVSVRNSSGGAKITLDGKRKRWERG